MGGCVGCEDEDEGSRQRVAQGDSVEAGRAAIDKWGRDGAGGLLHAHVRLMGSGAVAGAAGAPNEGGGQTRGVREPYRLQAQAQAQAGGWRGRRSRRSTGGASDIHRQHCTAEQPTQVHVVMQSVRRVSHPQTGDRDTSAGRTRGTRRQTERTPPGQLKGTAVALADADCRRRRCSPDAGAGAYADTDTDADTDAADRRRCGCSFQLEPGRHVESEPLTSWKGWGAHDR